MRVTSKRILIASLLSVLLASCASTDVGPRVVEDAAPVAPSHWQFDEARPPAAQDGYRPPRKLAVLLPMTGTLATAAEPVRDGLLAGYYAERRERPEMLFYDTAGNAGGAVAAYRKAIAEGADQIVGPLGRDEVAAVFAEAPGIPVVALNRGGTATPANATEFSLAPEDEGSAAAAFLQERNARRVLVLSSGDDNAQRSLQAFRARLEADGGSIVDVLPVAGEQPDLTAVMRTAASGEGGVDAVLMAVRGNHAHLLAPQLFAAGLGDRLRLATSQITLGTGKPEEDRVLDGIIFPTESWSVGSLNTLPAASGVGTMLPTARGAAARLFAFGHDAWQLSAYLVPLASRPGTQLRGATGTLTFDGDGAIVRTPVFATWRNGFIEAYRGN